MDDSEDEEACVRASVIIRRWLAAARHHQHFYTRTTAPAPYEGPSPRVLRSALLDLPCLELYPPKPGAGAGAGGEKTRTPPRRRLGDEHSARGRRGAQGEEGAAHAGGGSFAAHE